MSFWDQYVTNSHTMYIAWVVSQFRYSSFGAFLLMTNLPLYLIHFPDKIHIIAWLRGINHELKDLHGRSSNMTPDSATGHSVQVNPIALIPIHTSRHVKYNLMQNNYFCSLFFISCPIHWTISHLPNSIRCRRLTLLKHLSIMFLNAYW